MANGNAARRLGPIPPMSAASLMMNLQSAQLEDRRAANDNAMPANDNSIPTEISAPSPLELPERSYTMPEEEPDSEASLIGDVESQRARDERMRKVAQQFVGAPTTPTLEGGEAARAGGKKHRTRPTETEEEIPMSEEWDEVTQAMDLGAEQAAMARQAEQQQQQAQAEVDAAVSEQKSTQEQLKMMWRSTKLASGAAFESIIGLVVLVFVSNAQVINQYTFKNDSIPEADLVEDVFPTILLDLGVLLWVLAMVLPIFIIIGAVAIPSAMGIGAVSELFK